MSDDARDVFYYEMLQRAGLVRVEAPDGTVWWVSPESVDKYRTMPPVPPSQIDTTGLPPLSERQKRQKEG